jgi:3'-5' exoribonuclease
VSRRKHAAADSRLDPRAFCADGYPWRLIGELSDGEEVTACYLVHEVRRSETKQNKPFLKLTLGDRTGTIDGMVWDDAERWEPLCVADAVVGVRGKVGVYNERIQLRVAHLEPLRAEHADMEHLLPASPRPRLQMERELDELIASVKDAALHKLLKRMLGRGSATGREYRVHPAAKRNHHAYLCGLLKHSLSVAGACDRMAEHYAAQGLQVDRDLLVAGALLHDVGKVRELKALPSSGYTDEGQLLGHIVLGIQMVAEEARAVPDLPAERLLLLQHLIASHQGKPEWDSPKVPQLVEGLILHYADDLDAKLNPVRALLSGVEHGAWSAYDRNLARSFFLPPPALPASAEVEPVPAEEAVELFIDLFRG